MLEDLKEIQLLEVIKLCSSFQRRIDSVFSFEILNVFVSHKPSEISLVLQKTYTATYTVVYSTKLIITRLRLGSSLPILPAVYRTLIITLFHYNK